MPHASIPLTEHDYNRLKGLVSMLERHSSGVSSGLDTLEELLEAAEVVRPDRVPRNVATMNSTVRYQDARTGEEGTLTIAYPNEVDLSRGRISVLSPVGAALIGLAEGQEAELPLPHGKTRRIRIVGVLFQPEAHD